MIQDVNKKVFLLTGVYCCDISEATSDYYLRSRVGVRFFHQKKGIAFSGGWVDRIIESLTFRSGCQALFFDHGGGK